MVIMEQPSLVVTTIAVLQELDLVALYPQGGSGQVEMAAAARKCIGSVFSDFLTSQKLSHDQIAVIDGFFFLLGPAFSVLHVLFAKVRFRISNYFLIMLCLHSDNEFDYTP